MLCWVAPLPARSGIAGCCESVGSGPAAKRRPKLRISDGRPDGASGRDWLRTSRVPRLIAVGALVVVAAIAVGAASRPHPVGLSLSAAQRDGGIWILALLVLAGAMGFLLGANRNPIWVRNPNAALMIPSGKSRLPWGVRAVLTLLPFAVLVLVVASAGRLSTGDKGPTLPNVPRPIIPAGGETSGNAATLVLACLVVAVTAGLVAAVLFRKTPPTVSTQVDAPQDAAAEILDEGLGGLLAEREPRRAVIAAYVAMERAMARQGKPRRAHEAPTEYLARVLGVAPSRAADLDQLVGLYELARFSEHAVTASMRDAAIDAVRGLRAELQEPT